MLNSPLNLDILENHRISRSLVNETSFQFAEENMLLDTSKIDFSDTLNERALNDILGPLPEIPTNSLADCSSRLSVRRTSGSSGIYEEILEPLDSETRYINLNKNQCFDHIVQLDFFMVV